MKSKGKLQLTGSRQMSEDDVSSDEWFTRYLLDAVLLVLLMLTAIGVALYLDAGEYLRDWRQEPGAGFLACMVLCPMLVVVTLGLAVYAGIRLFLRPRTLGHASVRLALLVAHAVVFLVCLDTMSSTTTALVVSVRQSSSALDPTEAWRAMDGRDFSDSQEAERAGAPDPSSFSSPFGLGLPGSAAPGRGTGSR